MTVFTVSIVAFGLATIADIVLLVQTRRHRKELAAQEAQVRTLRQELKSDHEALRKQLCAAIIFADSKIREDLSEVLDAQTAIRELDHTELQKHLGVKN